MPPIDDFAQTLLEEAKRFLEKAEAEPPGDGKAAYLHAALSLAFCTLEAHINSIADDFLARPTLDLIDQSILAEKELKLNNGVFELGGLKMFRLEDRILYLRARFGGQPLDRNQPWWSGLSDGLKLRNQLAHPKDVPTINEVVVGRSIEAILSVLNDLYRSIYKQPYPALRRGLQSRLTF